MIIRELFEKDINRSINGVVKVQQTDEASIEQELSEYVVTRELQRHFANFFDSYGKSLDVPTDKIGVWISGFFGSGKSHFLKMLSYLLANKEIAGKPAVEYFDGKLEDPMVYSRMLRCANVPTETILFNIDSKGGQFKEGDTAKTALLRAFQVAYYEYRGFYGQDLKLAKLEEFIDDQGKTQQFRAAFERINGEPWLESRESYTYFEDDTVAALQEALGMSEQAARNWFDGSENELESSEAFAKHINEYVEQRAAQAGGHFRLLFMVDEVGQFIGSDVSLMLNLQTLVEDLGSTCGGNVWVMVTSQEAIDEVAMVVGKDFSKIQGRFNTRLSLSSSSVDEVIKRRVLDKTSSAQLELKNEYSAQSAVLKNLFTFSGTRDDMRGYESETEFAESYPFVGYQFKLLPDVMEEIRKHGTKAQHMSTGERSMLSAFQESTQAVQEEPLSALVPFWHFFDTISKDLEHGITRVFDRVERAAEAGQGLKPEDVNVLKVLYLVRYVSYVETTLGNISIFMVDSMDVDKVALRENVKASLSRLVNENYVARQGDKYNFLTNQEQDIERAINNTEVESAEVIDEIKKTLFSDLYTERKLSHGANNFPFDCYVDDSLYGASKGGMKLNVITLADSLSQASDGELELKSTEEAMVVLSNESDYYDVLLNAAKIRKYVRTQNVSQLDPTTQEIIGRKQKEANFNIGEAKTLLANAVVNARCAVNGHMEQVRATNAKQVFDQVLEKLASAVFSKANYITAPAESDEDARRTLLGTVQGTLEGMEAPNAPAVAEMRQFLELQNQIHQKPTMGDVQRKFQAKPYGWRDVDVALVAAQLIAAQEATLSFGGQKLANNNPQTVECLRKQADKAVLEKRVRAADHLLKKAAAILKDFNGKTVSPSDEDALTANILEALKNAKEHCAELIQNNFRGIEPQYPYPGRKIIEEGAHAVSQVLENQADQVAFLNSLIENEDALLDFAEDMEDVDKFFDTQKRVFDESVAQLAKVAKDTMYLEGNQEAQDAIASTKQILEMPKPYGKIQELSLLQGNLEKAHSSVVQAARNKLLDAIANEREEAAKYVVKQDECADVAKAALSTASKGIEALEGRVHSAETVYDLNALKAELDTWANTVYDRIDKAVAEERARRAKGSKPGTQPVEPPKPQPKTKTVNRTFAFSRSTLGSEAEIDQYLAEVKQKLVSELEGYDSIRLS